MARIGKAGVVGLKELEGAFAEISAAARKGVLRRAMAQAAKPIAQAMSDMAPVRSGALSKSPKIEGDVQGGIAGKRAYAEVMAGGGTRAEAQAALRAANKANPRQYQATVDIGPDKDVRHAHLVEFGTGPRFHDNGKPVGSMPPSPFVRPAWDTQGGAVAQGRIRGVLGQELAKSIARARARAAKKG